MAVQFAVLSSGSRGNSTLVCGRGAGLLIDVGIGPKVLGERLESVGSSWSRIASVVLTHTHADHVDTATFNELRAAASRYTATKAIARRSLKTRDSGSLKPAERSAAMTITRFWSRTACGSSRSRYRTTADQRSVSASRRRPSAASRRSESAILPIAAAGLKALPTVSPESI